MKQLLILLFLLLSFCGFAQQHEYNFLYEGIGDNREFFSGKATSQTILGSRAAFEAGLKIDSNRIRIGLSELYEFGSEIDFHKPHLILYYSYSDPKINFLFGSFPRRGKIDFPLAMLTDTLLYYRPNIEGMLGSYNWNWGNQLFFVDWTSRQTDTRRETFLVGSSGEIVYKNFFVQNYYLMYHRAGYGIKLPGDHIKDYVGFAIQGGFKFGTATLLNGYAKAGILTSLYRHRAITDGFVQANSLLAEAYLNYRNFAVKSVIHTGEGHNFAFGDRFYALGNYMRTDLIWYFINHEKVKGRFNWSLHFIDWEDLDQQQQLSIIYVFGK